MKSLTRSGASLSISAVGARDLPDLLDLYTHLVAEDPPLSNETAATILSRIASIKGSAIFLGRVEQTAVASCTLMVIPNLTRGGSPYALIENVVTHKAHRGLGYGQQLLHHAAQSAWDSGCYKIMLMTGSKQPQTHAFYLKCGFEASKTGYQMRRIAAREE